MEAQSEAKAVVQYEVEVVALFPIEVVAVQDVVEADRYEAEVVLSEVEVVRQRVVVGAEAVVVQLEVEVAQQEVEVDQVKKKIFKRSIRTIKCNSSSCTILFNHIHFKLPFRKLLIFCSISLKPKP